MSGDAAGECHVVVGLGLNVNLLGDVDVGQPCVSLNQVLEATVIGISWQLK